MKALSRVRGPRPDNYEDDPKFRSVSLRDGHNTVTPKRRLKDFAAKCRNGDIEDGATSGWTNQKHKCNLEGKKGVRLSCQERKPIKETLEADLCEPGQHMFSGRLEHNTKMYGYGTLFILDHGKRPFMDRSALGTVCMGRGLVSQSFDRILYQNVNVLKQLLYSLWHKIFFSRYGVLIMVF